MRELATGLRRLDFTSNFQTFEITTTIAASTEKKIRNQLTSKPNFVIIDVKGGGPVARSGDTEWTDDYVYIKNYDTTNEVEVKLIFFK